MQLILILWRYNSTYHNGIESIRGAFMIGKWSKESTELY